MVLQFFNRVRNKSERLFLMVFRLGHFGYIRKRRIKYLRMSNVPRKRYRRESLEENKKLSDESDEKELYIPLKERRKLQFSALEQNQGISFL